MIHLRSRKRPGYTLCGYFEEYVVVTSISKKVSCKTCKEEIKKLDR